MEATLHRQDAFVSNRTVDQLSMMVLYRGSRKMRNVVVGNNNLVFQLGDEAVSKSGPEYHPNLRSRCSSLQDIVRSLGNLRNHSGKIMPFLNLCGHQKNKGRN